MRALWRLSCGVPHSIFSSLSQRWMTSSVSSTSVPVVSLVLERSAYIVRDQQTWEEEFEQLHSRRWESRMKDFPRDAHPDQIESESSQSTSNELISDEDIDDRYRPAPRIPPTQNDIHSINRHFDKKVYFMIRDASSGSWTFPSLPRQANRSMRETVEDVFRSVFTSETECWPIGFAPIAHFPVPNQALTNFYYSALLTSPTFSLVSKQEYAWLSSDEIREHVGGDLGDLLRRALN